MQLLHAPNDPFLDETLRYIVQYALESPKSNMRVQTGTTTIACVYNGQTLNTKSVTFEKSFKNLPFLIVSKNPAIGWSTVFESWTNLTVRGFTAQIYTSNDQNVDFSFIAIGQV